MALFASSDDWLVSRLRLSDVPDSRADTQAIVAEAISDARISFYRRLGRTAISHLLETAEVAEPDTDDQVRRTLASQTELKLVRIQLLRNLPSAFMDASGDRQRRWNEEAPFRELPRTDREREIRRLEDAVEQAMQMLEADGDESPGDERTIHVYDGTPTCPPPLPGDTLFPRNRRSTTPD